MSRRFEKSLRNGSRLKRASASQAPWPQRMLLTMGLIFGFACTPGTSPDAGPDPALAWDTAFQMTEAGSISSVWGTSPDNVYAVGGGPLGTITHYDGSQWSLQTVPQVPLLVWVHGTGPTDIWAVGTGGGALHFDGVTWSKVETGVQTDLWGVFARSPTDVWVVGGYVDREQPVSLHFDGNGFSIIEIPESENPLRASALFKVWGIGQKLFAVGQRGLILGWDGDGWVNQPAGAEANDDFVSLWGSSEDQIIAVGGRSNARIARYDGTSWHTIAPFGYGGINGVYMERPGEALIAGVFGLAGIYNLETDEIIEEDTQTRFDLHAIWSDGAGRAYAVGGNFLAPYAGVARIRTEP